MGTAIAATPALADASAATAASAATGTVARVPDLNGGTWQVAKPVLQLRDLKGARPPLRPEAQALYEQRSAQRRAGRVDFDGTERCLPPGLPRLLSQPQPFEFLQRPDQIVILYQLQRLVRVIDTSGAAADVVGPTHLGTSVGRWQGGTLVVESSDFTTQGVLDDAGLPHGGQLRVQERYTPSRDGRSLVLRVRIDDPEYYTAPWESELRYRRDPRGEIAEDVCLERQHLTLWKDRP